MPAQMAIKIRKMYVIIRLFTIKGRLT